jgi:hypothetical protein
MSADNRVTITARGMREVDVRVADGTVRALSEREFSDRTREAVTALIGDHMSKIDELKRRYYP